MSDFKPGDRVNITIEGARIDEVVKNGIHVVMPNGTTASVELSNYDGVTVERATPAEWPPQPEDLWKHPRGALLFAMESGSNVVLTNSSGYAFGHEEAWEMRHEMTLVHREGVEGNA